MPDKLFVYHRIRLKLKMDVEQVPDKLFVYHRIRLKLKMDVESTRQAFSRAIRFGDKPKRMEKMPEMCQKSAQESFKSLHSHPSPQKYSPIKHGRDD